MIYEAHVTPSKVIEWSWLASPLKKLFYLIVMIFNNVISYDDDGDDDVDDDDDGDDLHQPT